MRLRRLIWGSALAVSLAVPAAALASSAVIRNSAGLRASASGTIRLRVRRR